MEKRKRKNRKRLVARVLLFLLFMVIFYFLVRPFAKIDFQLANLKLESVQLDNQIAKLQEDLSYEKSKLSEFYSGHGISSIARERFRMVYPGETLYMCVNTEGRGTYQIHEPEYRKLSKDFKKKSPIATAWDMFLSLFR